MEIDVVSEGDFRDLKEKFEALLLHLNLDYNACHHPNLGKHEKWNKFACQVCRGYGYIFQEKPRDQATSQ